MAEREFYIICDLHGGKRICETRVSVDSILACLDRGEDPSAIQLAFPALSLDQIQNTIAYIRSHPREIAEHRELQAARWDAARSESARRHDPVFDRLQTRRAEHVVEKQGGK
ncbi:MAG TPA: DUF433 domain-containing protein [Humisphaera sp.]|nr:DUF433 domain-containing protein [Humisphaera sp.]